MCSWFHKKRNLCKNGLHERQPMQNHCWLFCTKPCYIFAKKKTALVFPWFRGAYSMYWWNKDVHSIRSNFYYIWNTTETCLEMLIGFSLCFMTRMTCCNSKNHKLCSLQKCPEENVHPSVCDLMFKSTWIMQHDNDQKQASKSSSQGITQKAPKLFSFAEQKQICKRERVTISQWGFKRLTATYCRCVTAVLARWQNQL